MKLEQALGLDLIGPLQAAGAAWVGTGAYLAVSGTITTTDLAPAFEVNPSAFRSTPIEKSQPPAKS
jgi:hypothetical protein